jgi:hypothetical protein
MLVYRRIYVLVDRCIERSCTLKFSKYEAGMWWARLSWKITIKSDCCISQKADFHTGMLICVKLYQNKLVDSASTEFTANVTQKYRYPGKIMFCFKVWFGFYNEERRANTVTQHKLVSNINLRRFLQRMLTY